MRNSKHEKSGMASKSKLDCVAYAISRVRAERNLSKEGVNWKINVMMIAGVETNGEGWFNEWARFPCRFGRSLMGVEGST